VEFQDDHFSDALHLVGPLATAHPDIADIRELHGLTLYRLERWRDAARELEAFRRLTSSAEQNPVLADCYRALQRHEEADELWEEVAAQSPSAPIVAEGRIVAAASLADRDDLGAAIRLLEGARTRSGKPRPHDLRVWYALADLYDRAGDQPRARDLFARVVQHDRSFADAARRLTDLG
jgi:tetratricopeptide (TPR) repeat protein